MKLLIFLIFAMALLVTADSNTEELLRRKPKSDEDVDDLRDLLMASMENTIALTQVVTQQTQQISDMMLSLSAAKIEIQELKLKMAKNEADNSATAEKISEVKEDLGSMEVDIGTLKNGMSVTVLNGEEDNGDPKCAKVCSGTTGRTTTDWTDYGGSTGIYKEVDISGCGFVKIPTVTTSIEGSSSHWEVTGTSAVYGTTTEIFTIYIGANRPNTRKGFAAARKWNVEWIAVGFTC